MVKTMVSYCFKYASQPTMIKQFIVGHLFRMPQAVFQKLKKKKKPEILQKSYYICLRWEVGKLKKKKKRWDAMGTVFWDHILTLPHLLLLLLLQTKAPPGTHYHRLSLHQKDQKNKSKNKMNAGVRVVHNSNVPCLIPDGVQCCMLPCYVCPWWPIIKQHSFFQQ